MSNALRMLLILAAVAEPVHAATWLADTRGGAGSHWSTTAAIGVHRSRSGF